MVSQQGVDQTAVEFFRNSVELLGPLIPRINPVECSHLPIKLNHSLCLGVLPTAGQNSPARHGVPYFIASHSFFYASRRYHLA